MNAVLTTATESPHPTTQGVKSCLANSSHCNVLG